MATLTSGTPSQLGEGLALSRSNSDSRTTAIPSHLLPPRQSITSSAPSSSPSPPPTTPTHTTGAGNTLSVAPSGASTLAYSPSLSSTTSSVISRQSSCKSTSSVIAVPFKTPIRGGKGVASSTRFSESPTAEYYAPGRGGGGGTEVSTPGSAVSYPSSATVSAAGERSSMSTTRGEDDVGAGSSGERGGTIGKANRMLQSAANGRPLLNERVDSSGLIRKGVDDFTFGEILGEGSYSTVSSCAVSRW